MKKARGTGTYLGASCGTAQAGFMDEVDKLVTDGQQSGNSSPCPGRGGRHKRAMKPLPPVRTGIISSLDDFFISEQPREIMPGSYVTLSKMTQPLTPKPRAKPSFSGLLTVPANGPNISGVPGLPDRTIRLGALMIMFEGRQVADVYQQPEKQRVCPSGCLVYGQDH